MATRYHKGRALAITAGLVSTLGALAILLADPLTTGIWRLDHALLPVIVFVTIAAGHLVGDAIDAGKPLPAAGFALLFCLGTALTIYQSVGSQKAQAGDKALAVEDINGRIAGKQAEIAKSITRRDQADTMADREMTGQKCLTRCQDWKTRSAEVSSHIKTLEADLAALGAKRVARPKAEAAGEALSMLGYDKTAVTHVASVLEPFAFSLLLELTAIVAFGYGFGAPRQAAGSPTGESLGASKNTPSIADQRQTDLPAIEPLPSALTFSGEQPDPTPPKPRRRQLPANVVHFQSAQHPVLAAIERAGGSVASNRALAGLMAVTEGEASKRVDEVRSLLEIERCGKEKRIRLRA